jgi:HD-GYP domain-containing protein (c-di-GMP phosphodiesterase class II)
MVSKVISEARCRSRYHHERYDGPATLLAEGHAIPVEARIFTGGRLRCDDLHRPYRQAMPREDAMEEIRKNAGIQFDPEVVEAFERVIGKLHPSIEEAAA